MEKHELAEINVLIVHKRLLDFDLLLRISGNKVLASVCITDIGSDFHIESDKQHTI